MTAVHFGYDRAGPALDAYDAVVAAYGKPAWVGRYTELIPGTSNGLTVAEVAAIHARDMSVALCYNGATPADVASSTQVGQDNAAVAVRHAQAIGTPIGVALFLDCEAGWVPSGAFFTGWLLGCHAGAFVPGVYLNAQDANHINPLLAAIAATGIQAVIWSSEPEFNAWLNEAVTTWYNFSQTPLGTQHAGLVVLHQTGENELGGQVDLDIASDAGMAVLWGPKPPAPPPVKYPYPGHVQTPGSLKKKADHVSPAQVDGQLRPVYLEKGAEVSVLGEADGWLHVRLVAPESTVEGYLVSGTVAKD